MYVKADFYDDLLDVIDLTSGDDEAVDDMEFAQWPPPTWSLPNGH